MTDQFLTIWSRSAHGGMWLIERTYGAYYVRSVLGITDGGIKGSDGRIYRAFAPGLDPNQ